MVFYEIKPIEGQHDEKEKLRKQKEIQTLCD